MTRCTDVSVISIEFWSRGRQLVSIGRFGGFENTFLRFRKKYFFSILQGKNGKQISIKVKYFWWYIYFLSALSGFGLLPTLVLVVLGGGILWYTHNQIFGSTPQTLQRIVYAVSSLWYYTHETDVATVIPCWTTTSFYNPL